MRKPSSLAAVLACAAWLTHSNLSLAQTEQDQLPPPQSLAAQAGTTAPQTPCQTFTAPVTVGGGRQQQAVGKTCQQPDGSLQITLQAPGLPTQVYTMQPPQAAQPGQPQPLQPQPLQPEQLPQPLPPPPATYVYPYVSPYAYYAPPPVVWSNPWVFGGFPFFAGGSVFFVHDHFFFRDRFGHPFFFRHPVFFRDHVFFRNQVFFHDRFGSFHNGFVHRGFDGRGFHGSGVRMSGGGFQGGVGGRR